MGKGEAKHTNPKSKTPMIRLTVLYNLAAHVNEEEFVKWRLGDHQRENATQPGVLRTDFAIAQDAWPPGTPPRYRYMTTADWPDMETFRAAFYAPAMQASLYKNIDMLADPVFLISEIMTSSETKA